MKYVFLAWCGISNQLPHQQHTSRNRLSAASFFASASGVKNSYERFTQPSQARRYSNQRKLQIRQKVVSMFHHGYSSYMKKAFPDDELKPLTCSSHNSFGGYSLTLIDTLDMLAMIGDEDEFFKQVDFVARNIKFDSSLSVSVFETTIRVVGGLVTAHLQALDMLESRKRTKKKTDQKYIDYDGGLLRKAEEIAKKMLVAFDTSTGMPYNEVHLLLGLQREKGQETCPAAAGSLLMEFGMLSKLTGNCTYLIAARRALLGVWKFRSQIQLIGTTVDVMTGLWKNIVSTIGASVDSFFEYLFKSWVLFGDDTYHDVWQTSYRAVQRYLLFDGWYLNMNADSGQGDQYENSKRMHSLSAFWPGLQVQAGHVDSALSSYEKFFCVLRHWSLMPEYISIPHFQSKEFALAKGIGPGYPLRPEFIESTYFLHRVTQEDIFLEIAEEFLDNLETKTKVPCGFAAILDVGTMSKENKMDSFMLAETLKYLYLIF